MHQSTTDKLALPFLQPGQALKTITHNEALQRLDTGLYLACSNMAAEVLPTHPIDGETLVLSAAFTSNHPNENAGDIAVFRDGVWLWFTPKAGWTLWDTDDETLRIFDGENWIAPHSNSQTETRPHLGLNATASESQRLAIASATSLFTHDGDSHRMSVNRADETQTASLIFQTDYAGNAELGLTGPDGFSLKTSPDGTHWSERLSTPQNYSGLRAPAFGSVRVSIDNDSSQLIPTPASGGIFAITVINDNGLPLANRSGLLAYDTGSTPSLISLAKTGLVDNLGAAVLSGNTGTIGNLGLSAVSGGLYVENRINGRRDISLTFLC